LFQHKLLENIIFLY